jgi:hypothetical protein
MRVRMTLAAAVAASLTLGACASMGGNGAGLSSPLSSTRAVSGASASGGSSGVAAEPTVRVQNQNWSDVVVYAVRGGRRHRLGMVTSMSSARFRLPRGLAMGSGDLQLVVDPIGSSRGFTSQPIHVGNGQDIALSVQNHLPMSTVSLWNHR